MSSHTRLRGPVSLAVLGLLLLPGRGHATDQLDLSLDRAVQMSLELNPGIRSARLGTKIQSRAVAAEEARFGRSAGVVISHQAERSPSISALEAVQTSTSDVLSVGATLSQELSSGGRLGASFTNQRLSSNAAYRTVDPVYQSEVGLEFSQPLMRGRGNINRVGLHLARNELDTAGLTLERRVRDLKADVGLAYWDLFYARQNLQVQRQLTEGARRVLETVETRAQMGAGPRNSILQAQVGKAQRDEGTVIAEGAVAQAEDRLRSLMGLDQDPEAWHLRLVPQTSPTLQPFDSDLATSVDRAVKVSPAYRSTQIQLQSLDLQVRLARDRARPDVDLTARLGVTGIGGSYSDNAEVLGKADGRSWRGSLLLSLPFGTTPDDERLSERLLEKQRAEVDLERLRLDIVRQMREQHRRVNVDRRRAEVAQFAQSLAAQNVDEQEERLALGLSSVRQVLDAQDDLAAARNSHLRALVDYNQALVEWGRLTEE